MPRKIQESFIKTISGLEHVEFLVHGYAVEYDVVDVTQLDETLQSQDIEGLYFAGQINGTSGYEEAAGQGLVAGMNAALSFLGKEPLVFERMDSYIGVMVGDLTSNKRDEPYRLFTARSENRLFIREDNVINRIAPYRSILGLSSELDRYQESYLEDYEVFNELCDRFLYKLNASNINHFNDSGYGSLEDNITLAELLRELIWTR